MQYDTEGKKTYFSSQEEMDADYAKFKDKIQYDKLPPEKQDISDQWYNGTHEVDPEKAENTDNTDDDDVNDQTEEPEAEPEREHELGGGRRIDDDDDLER